VIAIQPLALSQILTLLLCCLLQDIEMPPEQPGQERFLQAQATKGRGDPEYIKANEDSEHLVLHQSDLVNRPYPRSNFTVALVFAVSSD
jgi:hypothetical protein